MAKGGGKRSGGAGAGGGSKGSKGGKGGKGGKSTARVSGRGTSASTPSDTKAPKKFGQLSRKERDMMEDYGELVPQDFEEDETDRVGSFRKVVKESELDYHAAMKRDREMESHDEAEEDEYKLDRPSAFNKLVGILKKSSKRQDEWKKRKLEEEGLEDMEDDEELEVEEEVVTLTEAERKALIKKHGKQYLKALDGEDDEESDMEDQDAEKGDDDIEAAEDSAEDEDDIQAIAEEEQGSDDSDEEEHFVKSKDNFDRHFSDMVTPLLAPKVAVVELAGNKWKSVSYEDPVLKRVEKFDTDNVEGRRKDVPTKKSKSTDLLSLLVKQRVQAEWPKVNESALESSPSKTSKVFTPLQQALFDPLNEYRDILFTSRTMQNTKELRNLYVLHALNHVYKTRDRILKNTGKLQRHQQNQSSTAIPEFRDQGFTRPKVLIILPFKNTVVDVVESLIALSGSTQQENRKRFFDEFGAGDEDDQDPRNSDRP
ncbi:rRNA-binding ribosome biosynthesis protein utp25, partial [Mortierella polycephala]